MADKTAASATKPKVFKPKAGVVRKTKAEREAHAKQEAEKAAARAAAAAQAAGKPSQPAKSTGPRKRDHTRDNRDANQGSGGGVFGAGTGARQTWRKPVLDVGRSEILEGQEGIKPADGPVLQGQDGESSGQTRRGGGGGGGGGGGPRILPDGTVIESDDEPEERGDNIETIQISDDEDGDNFSEGVANGKARARSEGRKVRLGGFLRPIRAPGMSDEENTDTDQSKKKGKSNHTGDDEEGGDEDQGDDMEVDSEHTALKQDPPSSPELSKRIKPGRKVVSRAKDSKAVHETVEERAERLRLSRDVENLKDNFLTSPQIKKQDEMDTDKTNRPEGKLFLFQLPPLVPFLVNQESIPSNSLDSRQEATVNGQAIKTDPDEVVPTAAGPLGNPSSTGIPPPKTKMEGMLTAGDNVQLPPGRVGKLRVHKSGKVTLDWGGIDMEVRYGTQVDFLQTAVLVEKTPSNTTEDAEEKSSVSQNGTAYALGQISTKIVVIPDWQKLYD